MNSKEIKLKNGMVMRPPRMDEVQAAVDLCNLCFRHYTGADETDTGEMLNFWSTPTLKLDEDTRVITSADGEWLGYVEANLLGTPPVHPHLGIRVHPDYLDSDIPELLMAWADEHTREALDRCPPDVRVSVHSFMPVEAKRFTSLLEANGYKLIRHSVKMAVDLNHQIEEPVWPEGVELRPFVESEHMDAVYRAWAESFADHYGFVARPHDEGLARFRHQLVEDDAHDPSMWFVAWDGDQIVGLSLCFTFASEDPNMGWLEDLAVRRPWRKRGLGRALLLHTFREFHKRGKLRVGLGADASNLTGAVNLYKNVGMYVTQQYDRYEKELRPGKELMTTGLSE